MPQTAHVAVDAFPNKSLSLSSEATWRARLSERTKTVLLSRHGAGIISTYKLSPEQELVIRSEESRKEIEARVRRPDRIGRRHLHLRHRFLDRETNFWGIDFPRPVRDGKARQPNAPGVQQLSHSRDRRSQRPRSDVMAINDSIVRYCQKCGSSTLWKHAVPGSLPAVAVLPAGASCPA